MTLYDRNELKNQNNTVKYGAVAIAAAWSVTVALSIVLCCFTNLRNALLFRIILTAVWVLVGWFTIACLFVRIFPAKKRAKLINYVLTAEKKSFSGTVIKVGDTVTFAKARTVEVVISDGNADTVLYIDCAVENGIFEGDKITCLAADRLIFEYEVAND